MNIKRAFGALLFALTVAIPATAFAQNAPASPDSLSVATNNYFNAILHADGPALSGATTRTFHEVLVNGKQLSYEDFMRGVFADAMQAREPKGINVNIKSSNVGDARATETVNTLMWYYGALSNDPMAGPVTGRDFSTHELTWVKSPSGKWLLDQDHITSVQSM